ncbi:MAG: helix-turn-helix transcriptional regulator [Spirosomataceae bacterium]
MTYGTTLRNLREQQRLTQKEVADLLDIAQSTYSLWESDKSTPQVEYIPKLANALKVDIMKLIPQEAPIKIVNNTGNRDTSINGFEVKIEGKDLFKDLLESKEEIIKLLREEIRRLQNNTA